MNKALKRLISLALVAVMVAGIVPFNLTEIYTSAANVSPLYSGWAKAGRGYVYDYLATTKEQGEKYYSEISKVLDSTTAGKVYSALFSFTKGKSNYSVFGGVKNVYSSGYQCYQYSKDMSMLITGKSKDNGTKRQYETYIGGAKAGERPDALKLKGFFEEYATTGEFVYLWWNNGSSSDIHAFTFLSCDADGIFFIDNTKTTPSLSLKYISYATLAGVVYNATDKTDDTYLELFDTVSGSNANLFTFVDECLKKTFSPVNKLAKTTKEVKLTSLPHDPAYNNTFGTNSEYRSKTSIPKGTKIILKSKVNNGHNGEIKNDWYLAEYDNVTGYIYSGNIDKNSFEKIPEPEKNFWYEYNSICGPTLNNVTMNKGTAVRIQGNIKTYTKKMTKVNFFAFKYNSKTGAYDLPAFTAEEGANGYTYEFKIANNVHDSCLNAKYSISSLDAGYYRFIMSLDVEDGCRTLDSGVFKIVDPNNPEPTKQKPATTASIPNSLLSNLLHKAVDTVSKLLTDAVAKESENSKLVNLPTSVSGAGSSGGTSQKPAAAIPVYYAGIYRVSSASNVNVRTGAGTSYPTATSSIPKGTEIGITEVSSNGWGKTLYKSVEGWVYLGSCTFVRNFANIQKPGTVSVTLTSASDVAKGTNVSASWSPINYADSYIAYLKNSSGTVVDTVENIKGTYIYFTVKNAGTYSITVRAANSQYTGDESAPSASFTVHEDCRVSFVDWNGRTEVRTTSYGSSVQAPDPPTREGYTFIGWDKTFDHVLSDITVNATYKINTYTVKFIKETGEGTIVLDTQRIDYGSAAVPPEDVQVPAFTTFVGWDSDEYKCVKQNLTVKAVYHWANNNLPVGITELTATRINGGYNVTFKVSCTEASVTNVRAIVSLKTSENKQISVTESEAFSLASNTHGKLKEIYVPSDSPASVATVYVVKSFGNSIPQSESVSCTVNLNDQWSDWSTNKPADNTYDMLETKMEWKYQNKEYSTGNSSKSLPGWTYLRTNVTGESSGSTYSYISSYSSDSYVRTVTPVSEPIYSTWYRYHHYTNGGYNQRTGKAATWTCSPWYGNADDGYGPTNIGPHYVESSYPLSARTSTTWNIPKYEAKCSTYVSSAGKNCLNTWFYNQETFQKQTGSQTRYNYRDVYYSYDFYRWSAWSAWTTTQQYASSEKNVESRTVYRFKNADLGVEDKTGIQRIASTKSADLTETDILLPQLPDYTGEEVDIYIYKYTEASDWTGEYIDQTTIDSNGDYSFSFKLREEPTETSGDFIVTIGIEGCEKTITVGRIVAPKPTYKVVFKAADPTDCNSEYEIVDEQTVREGEAVTAPENPEYTGYKFLGWDTNLSYITDKTMFVENGDGVDEKVITFTARYEPMEYVVVFIDWEAEDFVMRRYHYGDKLGAPTLGVKEGYDSTWKDVDENTVVIGDMVVTASIEKKIYEVNFFDYDGNIIDTQCVPYQETAADIEAPSKTNYIFEGWEYTTDSVDVDENGNLVGTDTVINFFPIYEFSETTANPVSSLEDGTYDEVQTITLTTETENAVIYYTLDGTDPSTAVINEDGKNSLHEYTGPFTLDHSAVLKYYACAFEHNDSEVITNYYAVNAGVTQSEWMTTDELPDYVSANPSTYNTETAQGYRSKDVYVTSNYADILTHQAEGWIEESTSAGEWSDWMIFEPSFEGIDYELDEPMIPEPEEEIRYQYSRYKYLSDDGETYSYSPTAVEGMDCELETIQLENKLSTAGYYNGTTVKYYNYNGERWFNNEIVDVEVVPDYLMHRYRLINHTLTKWTDWSDGQPDPADAREQQTAEIIRYSIPEMHVVNIVPDYSEFGSETLTYLVEGNTLFDVNEDEYSFEGYDFVGFFTDSSFTTYYNIAARPITSDMTLYPKYNAHEFTVIFFDYDGSILSEQTLAYGDYAMEPEIGERDGYVFIGWDSSAYTFVSDNMVIEAQYVPENEFCTVSLDRSKYNMMAGNSFRLNVTVLPEDTEKPNVIWYSTDESVASVDDEGFVTAIGEGVCEICVEAESTGSTAFCELTVSANPSDTICVSALSEMTVDSDYSLLRGVKNGKYTAGTIKNEFMNDADCLIAVDINGNPLADDAPMGTGSVIRLVNGETVKDEITVVVTGDMNGDGFVNNRDAAMITRYLVDKETASFAQMCAIDVNGDGSVNVRDASMISRYLVGKEII